MVLWIEQLIAGDIPPQMYLFYTSPYVLVDDMHIGHLHVGMLV